MGPLELDPLGREPLAKPELEHIWRWERLMFRFYIASMTALAAAALLSVRYADIQWLRRGMLGVVLVLVAVATVMQFRARCPRCNGRLRLKRRLQLPERCLTCMIPFPRPPEGSGSNS